MRFRSTVGIDVWLVVGGLLSAVLLGAGTARLLAPSELPSLVARGEELQEKVDSLLRQVRAEYPAFDVEVRGLGADGILLKVGWVKPDPSIDDYAEVVSERVKDQREALLLFFQSVAAADPRLQNFGAFEDRLIVPIWSRDQIVSAGDPRDYRDWENYSRFQLDAAHIEGYGTITPNF